MKTAEQFFRDKAFPNGIDDTAWELWKVNHSGIAWQGFSIKAMEEFAEEEAIAFAEFKGENWQQFHDYWYKRDNIDGRIVVIDPYTTDKKPIKTKELYEIFKRKRLMAV